MTFSSFKELRETSPIFRRERRRFFSLLYRSYTQVLSYDRLVNIRDEIITAFASGVESSIPKRDVIRYERWCQRQRS